MDYDKTFPCLRCSSPVRLMVESTGCALLVLWYWIDTLGCLCMSCLEASRKETDRATAHEDT